MKGFQQDLILIIVQSSLAISNDRTRQTFETFLKELGIDFSIESKFRQLNINQVKLICHILHIQNVLNLHSKHDALKKFWTEILPHLNTLKAIMETLKILEQAYCSIELSSLT